MNAIFSVLKAVTSRQKQESPRIMLVKQLPSERIAIQNQLYNLCVSHGTDIN